LKILLLCNKVPYPANDGSTIAMASMISGLLASGAEVHALCFNTEKHFRREEEIESYRPEGLKISPIYLDNRIKPLGAFRNLFGKMAYQVSRFLTRDFRRALEAKLAADDFDLVQIEGLSMAVYLKYIRKMSRVKVVLRAHNVEHQIWQRHLESEPNPLLRAYLRLQNHRLKNFEEAVSYEVDAIVTITGEDLQQFRNLRPSKVSISIPCGVSLSHYPQCDAESWAFDLVYIASFDWLPNRQGLYWFLDTVWPRLIREKPDISFRLCGRPMPLELRERRDQNLIIEPEVPKLRPFICSGKIAVIPLLAGSGMRIKILENMALGICQVTTSVGAEGIAVTPGEDIVIADQPEAMARSILNLLREPVRIAAIGQKARQTARVNYSNEKLGRELMEFYQTEVCI
jgi:glycosyltransferase involved in cell wall biosynthesis